MALAGICSVMLFAAAALAQSGQPQSQQANPPPPAAPQPAAQAPARPLPPAERVGVNLGELLPLTLEEAITLALQNSNDIEASRDEVRMSEFSLLAARGVYDPRLTAESYYRRANTPIGSTLGGGANGSVTQTDAVLNAGLNGFTPVAGGSYLIDFTSTRTTTNNQFASLNPQFPTGLTFNYTQPLWRGLRIDDNRRQIRIAQKNLALSDAQFRERAIEVITSVTQAYWDLVFALQNEQVQREAVKQARAQFESNRRQVEQGVLAPIDVVAAEAQIATFEQNVYTAQEAITRAENTLKTLLLPGRAVPEWTRPLQPLTPANLAPPSISLPEAVSNALANRPELEQMRASAEINQINTRFFRDQTKPQIDLVGTYTTAGLAGTIVDTGPNPLISGFEPILTRLNQLSAQAGLEPLPPFEIGSGAVPDRLVGGFSQSFSNLFAQRFPTVQVGLRFTLPIRNRTAEGNLGRSLAEGSRIRNQREQLEQQIEAEVRNALQAVRSAEARLAASVAARTAAEQLFESEQRQLQAGVSTVFLVFERQTELINSRGRELQAQTDLNKAIAQLQRASGTTLRANNVTIRNDGRDRLIERENARLERK